MPIFRMPVVLHANCPHADSPHANSPATEKSNVREIDFFKYYKLNESQNFKTKIENHQTNHSYITRHSMAIVIQRKFTYI